MTAEPIEDLVLDRVLASGLTALAPEVEPVDLVLAELRPRFRRARTRRRVVQASAVLTALLVVGALAVTQAPSMKRSHVTVESPSQHSQASRTPKPTTHSRRTATQARQPASTNAPGTSSASGVSVPPASSGTSAANNAPPPASSAPASTQPPPRVAPASTARYFSFGGSILVQLDGGRLRLLQVSPDKGNRDRVTADRPTHVDVVFTTRKGGAISRIEVIVVNGHMRRVPHAGAAQDSAVMRFGSTTHMSSASGSGRHEVVFEAVSALPSAGRLGQASGSTKHASHMHNKNRHAGNGKV